MSKPLLIPFPHPSQPFPSTSFCLFAGVSSSSILPSDFGGKTIGSKTQGPQLDIVQYDATIPDDDSSDVPILFADPFADPFRYIHICNIMKVYSIQYNEDQIVLKIYML